jgi:hypothetical protein
MPYPLKGFVKRRLALGKNKVGLKFAYLHNKGEEKV